MDFDDHDDLEEEEDEDEEEGEEEEMQPTAAAKTPASSGGGEAGVSAGQSATPSAAVRYRECLKNHAVGIGGQAVDGCGEFMPAGEEGSLDALKCAACNCHRNFHRKETDGGGGEPIPPQFSPYSYRGPPPGYLHFTTAAPQRPLALPAVASGGYVREEEDVSNPSSGGGGGGTNTGSNKKRRQRTKFTAEQKEKMRRFSERVGWRIQKKDEEEVERFCAESGVRRKVLKVWMHNNKHTHTTPHTHTHTHTHTHIG